jgi:hypothetical protein
MARTKSAKSAAKSSAACGLIFFKYIAGNREEHRAKLIKGEDGYKAENVFCVPHEARWSHRQASSCVTP